MSNIAESKVDVIIKALAGLENDIDSIKDNLEEMKKTLNSRVNNEIEKNMENITKMATKEAENMIAEAKQKAEAEAEKIVQSGKQKLEEIQNNIDSKFDESVDYVVSTVLKA